MSFPKIKHLLRQGLWTLLSLILSAFFALGCIILYFEMQLPDVNSLKELQMQIPLQIYTEDGYLIQQYGPERREPISINEVPKLLINAVLATEDQRYFEHPGVDLYGLGRAGMELLTTGTKSQGGSTITMQVARNFFLTPEKTYSRKIKEILLAVKIDSTFSKEKILELYLNKIYFGNRAYGVAAAAHLYYGKQLNQLTLAEMAMLAGLPKAPSALNPLVNPIAAKERRNHVLERMYERGFIDKNAYYQAITAPIAASYHGQTTAVDAPYVAEMVRDAMVEHYGEKAYTKGYKVFTTISSKTQAYANQALRNGLIAYDQRHGYRGPSENWGVPRNVNVIAKWTVQLEDMPVINNLIPGVVLKVDERSVVVLIKGNRRIQINWPGLKWARREIDGQPLGPTPFIAEDVLKEGDVIRVLQLPDSSWELVQIPEVEGALVSLNPNNGAIKGLVGGFDFYSSSYNRVIQANRQPGSNFKPFIYSAALSKGYTLATVINDAPIVISIPGQDALWRPQNTDRKFHGPTRLHVGLVKSINLVSIRILQNIGAGFAVNFATRFGFTQKQLPRDLSLALGTALVTPLQMATGYAVFANGGYKVKPYLIEKVYDNNTGEIVYQAKPKLACEACIATDANMQTNTPADQIAPQVINPQLAYLMTSVLKDVILHGTGVGALSLNRSDIAGKTGTTNDQMDAWFTGFNSDVVTSVWVGFDQPRTLFEYGADAALPMWVDFMRNELHDKPIHTMPEPAGIVSARIDPRTGLLAYPGQNGIFEYFTEESVPGHQAAQNYNYNPSDQEETPPDGKVAIPTPLF